MSYLSLIPVPLYQPLDPYNHEVDNIPIKAITEQISVLSDAIDNNTIVLTQSIGTQGSLSNRLNQSINQDGTLKSTAINIALHSIEEHLDTSSYVRMTVSERSKLSMVANSATALQIRVNTISGQILFDNETLEIGASDSVEWGYESGKIVANTTFPASVRHIHYYGLIPVAQNLVTPDYKNYLVTSVGTAYREGSLRVFINGWRLDPNIAIFIPMGLPTPTYLSLTYTEGTATDGVVTSGGFTLSQAIPSTARIIVDFDVIYT